MASSASIRDLLRARWFAPLVGALLGVGVAVGFRYLWREWTFFAFAVSTFYLMGTFRLAPWRTPLRKAIAIGLFVGIALPMIEWLYNIGIRP